MNILSTTPPKWQFNSLGPRLNSQKKVKMWITSPWYAALDPATGTGNRQPTKLKWKCQKDWGEMVIGSKDVILLLAEAVFIDLATITHLHSCFCQSRDSQKTSRRTGFMCTEQNGFQTAGNCKRSNVSQSSTAQRSRSMSRKRQRLFSTTHSAFLWRYPRPKSVNHVINRKISYIRSWETQMLFLIGTTVSALYQHSP